MRSTPVHYLSDEARQPLFDDVSDIDDLRLMSPEERDRIARLAQPSVKMFDESEVVGGWIEHEGAYIYWGHLDQEGVTKGHVVIDIFRYYAIVFMIPK